MLVPDGDFHVVLTVELDYNKAFLQHEFNEKLCFSVRTSQMQQFGAVAIDDARENSAAGVYATGLYRLPDPKFRAVSRCKASAEA
jgi:hypothetical protein